jgi:hypothetical protein
MFSSCGRVNLIEVFGEVGLDTSNTTGLTYMAQSSLISRFPTLDSRSVENLSYLFHNNTELVEIKKIILKDDGSQIFGTYSFSANPALEEIRFEGKIGQDGFNISSSTKLTHDSIMSIIDALFDYSGSGTTHTIALGTANINKLTDSEKAIATQRGWTLA